jgi:hypothetical protein
MFSAGSCLTAAPSSVAVFSPRSVVCRAYFGQAENVARAATLLGYRL